MKKKIEKTGNTIARVTPPLQDIILPKQQVTMDSLEYHLLMRQRIQNAMIEKYAAKVKH